MTDRIAVRAIVSGRVQGVGFRYWAQQEASDRDLVGYVRNLPNGDVEAVLVGEEMTVNLMLDLLWEGPLVAKVKGVKTEYLEECTEFSEFAITR